MKQKDRLQNSLTNVKSWKEKSETAKQSCDKACENCKTQNEKLQQMPEQPESDLSTQFNQVKKYSDEVLAQERQTRQIQQYLTAAEGEIETTRTKLPELYAS